MAELQDTQSVDLEIMVGVLGGASISKGSGKLISDQLTEIIKSFNQQGVAQIKVNADVTSFKSQVKKAIEDLQKTTIKVNASVAGGYSSSPATQKDSAKSGSTTKASGALKELRGIAKIRADIIKLEERQLGLEEGSVKRAELAYQIRKKEAILKEKSESFLAKRGTKFGFRTSGDVEEYIKKFDSVENATNKKRITNAEKVDVRLKKNQKTYENSLDSLSKYASKINNLKAKELSLIPGSSEAIETSKEISILGEEYKKARKAFLSLEEAQKHGFKTDSDLINYVNGIEKVRLSYIKFAKAKQAVQADLIKSRDRLVSGYDKAVSDERLYSDFYNSGFITDPSKTRDEATNGKYGTRVIAAKKEYDSLLISLKKQEEIVQKLRDGDAKFLKSKNTEINKLSELLDRVQRAKHKLDAEMNDSRAIKKFAKRIGEFYKEAEKTASSGYLEKLRDMFNKAKTGDYTGGIKELVNDFSTIQNMGIETGEIYETLGQKITRVFKEKFGYGVMAVLANQARRAITEVYSNVVDLDAQMTELKKVTEETDQVYRDFFEEATVRAREMGATVSDTIRATADFARLGYALPDASKMADAALIYKNVGDGIETIDDAAESLISTTKAFEDGIEDPLEIIDKFNEVGNNFPISSKGIGDALLRSASALASANNTLDESISLVTAANAVVQDPDKVGTAMKTVSMFLRAAKTEAEEAGESTEGMAQSASKLREQLLAITNNRVDIMADENTFKSTYQIMKELSLVWQDLADVDQANILEKIGGKRQANIVSGLLSNFKMAEEVLLTTQEATGSAMEENAKYLDSINGRLAILDASYETLSSKILNSWIVKSAISFLTGVVNSLNKLDEATNGAATALITLGTVMLTLNIAWGVLKKKFFSDSLVGQIGVLGTLTKLLAKLKTDMVGLGATFVVSGSSVGGFIKVLISSLGPGGKIALAIAGVMALIAALLKLNEVAHPSTKKIKEELGSLESDLSDLETKLQENIEKIKELKNLVKSGKGSFITDAELRDLETENEYLSDQIAYKKKLAENKEKELHEETKRKVDTFMNGSYGFGESKKEDLRSQIEEYKFWTEEQRKAQRDLAEDSNNQDAVRWEETYGEKAQSSMNKLLAIEEELISYRGDLSPENTDDLKEIDFLLNSIQIAIHGISEAGPIWEKLWSENSPIEGLTVLKPAFEEAATKQNELNEQLKQTGGNVDINNRKLLTYDHILQQIEEDGGSLADSPFSNMEPGDHATVDTQTWAAQDFFEPGSRQELTEAVLVTPILPDGTVVTSQDELYNYVNGLINPVTGKFDLSKDTKGLVVGLFDEGSFEASIQAADSAGVSVHELNAAFSEMNSNPAIEELIKQFVELGILNPGATIMDLVTSFIQLNPVVDEAVDNTESLLTKYTSVSELAELVKSAKDEYKEFKKVGVDTLTKIQEKWPEMAEAIEDYLTGSISSKDFFDKLEEAYQNDLDSYNELIIDKVSCSQRFYDSLDSNKRNAITALAGAYNTDKANFKTVEEAKLAIQAGIIKKMLGNYQKYAGMSLEQLKAEEKAFNYRYSQMSSVGANADKVGSVSAFDSLMDNDESKALHEAIRIIEEANSNIDDIVLEGLAPTPKPDKAKGSKSQKDEYHEMVQKKINSLKHQLEMDQITQEEYYDKLEEIELKYYKDSEAHRKKYVSDIEKIDEELFKGRREIFNDWINDQTRLAESASAVGNLSQTREIYNAILEETYKMIDQAKAYGLDESSDYVQELRDQAKKTAQDILNTVKKGFDDFENYADTFNIWDSLDFTKMDFLEAQLKEIEDLYASGMLAWHDYIREYNEVAGKMYDIQKDSIETIIDMTMEMIEQEAEDKKEALEEQIDDYKEIIDLKKKMLQETNDEADYEKKVAKIVDEIAKLQSKIAQLSLDDSREALADRIALEEELAEKQSELNDLQQDHALEGTIDTLDKSEEAFEKEKKDEIDTVEKSVDTWAKKYKQAIDRIDNDWDNLYVDLQDWMDEHRSSIDGPDSLKTSWENVIALKEKYKDLGGIEDIYNGMGNGMGIDPNAPKSEQAQQILDQMKQNSLSALRNPGSAGAGLNAANKKLRDQYYELTGQMLYQGSDFVWRYDNANGAPVYDLSGPVAEQNPYSPGRARFGETDSDAVRWAQYQLRGANYSQPVDGNFWQTTKKNILAFQKKMRIKQTGEVDAETIKRLKAYHSGGIVDGTGAINDREVVAVLERGEWVLDKKKQSAVKSLISNMFGFIDSMTSSNLASKINPLKNTVVGHGDTFAPHVEVNITHNGKMTDADARKYGKMAGDVALEELRTAFKKRGL